MVGGLLAQVLEGELLVVVGQVGAGKSSLLSAMLGEMRLQHVRYRPSTARRIECHVEAGEGTYL